MKTFSTAPEGETLVPIRCAVCGSTRTRLKWDCGTYRFQRCLGCGVLYQNPQPIVNDVLQRYDEDYYRYELENEENFFRLMLLGLEDVGFPEFEAHRPKPRRFLDIGCATGRLLEEMRARGWECFGVEVCGPSVRHAREVRGLDVFQGTLERAPYEPQSFDVIHSSHVIEHVNDPRLFLERIRTLLKPDGEVFLVTPCFTGLQARLMGPHWRSAIADHLYLFSRRTLARLLESVGLKPLRWKTWGGLAAGLAPSWIKRPLDRLAKAWSLGDVMMVRSRRS